MNNCSLGRAGEKLAENFLNKNGYKILEKNFWCRYGEIDLIAKDKDYLSFIEVKFSRSFNFILPQEKITKGKQEKIKKVAQYYLNFKKIKLDFRFDVILIVEDNSKTKIELIKNAFWVKERI